MARRPPPLTRLQVLREWLATVTARDVQIAWESNGTPLDAYVSEERLLSFIERLAERTL